MSALGHVLFGDLPDRIKDTKKEIEYVNHKLSLALEKAELFSELGKVASQREKLAAWTVLGLGMMALCLLVPVEGVRISFFVLSICIFFGTFYRFLNLRKRQKSLQKDYTAVCAAYGTHDSSSHR